MAPATRTSCNCTARSAQITRYIFLEVPTGTFVLAQNGTFGEERIGNFAWEHCDIVVLVLGDLLVSIFALERCYMIALGPVDTFVVERYDMFVVVLSSTFLEKFVFDHDLGSQAHDLKSFSNGERPSCFLFS